MPVHCLSHHHLWQVDVLLRFLCLAVLNFTVCVFIYSNALRVLLYSRSSVMMLTPASRLAAPHTPATSHRVQLLRQSRPIHRQSQVENLSHSQGWSSCSVIHSVIAFDVAHFQWCSAVISPWNVTVFSMLLNYVVKQFVQHIIPTVFAALCGS